MPTILTVQEERLEKTGMRDMDLSRTILPEEEAASEDLSLLSARLILFSSSTRNQPTGILDGATGFTSASCSPSLVCKHRRVAKYQNRICETFSNILAQYLANVTAEANASICIGLCSSILHNLAAVHCSVWIEV